MDERCVDCPWFDNKRKACRRKPPRFCDVDAYVYEEAPSPLQVDDAECLEALSLSGSAE